ncbi:MAG: DNA polymerase III subunit gamma/tau [Candidatus Gracilibacteria bacterium]|jgi:DNA polymerase-3 subunit gamma/tau
MSEIALYRKYRPQNFGHLVGQDHIRQTLLNAVKNNGISHAYLFCGPRGTGKTTTARLVAKAVNCSDLQENGEPCEKCDFCVEAIEGRLIDLIEIDAASNRGIDEIRDLKEKIKFSPTRAKAKIYIIDEVHMLSKDAFNALLKTLEEPPSHVYFILATTESHKVPETIISRCQRFDFKRVDIKSIVARLGFIAQQEGIEAELDALELIARNVDGGLRDAIGLMEQLTFDGKLTYEFVKKSLGLAGHKAIEQLYDYVLEKNVKSALSTISEIHFDGYDLSQFTKDFLECLRGKMLEEIRSGDTQKVQLILGMVDRFQEAYEAQRGSLIPQLPLEVAVIKICLGEVEEVGEVKEVEEVREEKKDKKEVVVEEEKPLVDVAQERPADAVLELSLDSVKRNFPRILENIATPAIKRSFQTGTTTKVEGNDVTVSFATNFHLEKVNNVQGHDVIERAFRKVFSQTVKLKFELGKVNIQGSLGVSKSDEAVDKAVEALGWEIEGN